MKKKLNQQLSKDGKAFDDTKITQYFMDIIYNSYDTITNRLEMEKKDPDIDTEKQESIEKIKNKIEDLKKKVSVPETRPGPSRGFLRGGRKTRKYRGGYQYSKSRKRRNSISKGKRKNPSIGKGIGKSISKSIGKSISKRKRKRRRSTLKGKNIGRRSKRNSIRKR